jgi:predicted permease
MKWFRRPPAGNEIDEELRFHLEEKQRGLIADGLTPTQARREARKSFGSQAAVREHARDAWVIRWVDDVWRDLRFAARGLRRSPGFTAVAVLTLALGIGANATIFSFVNALLIRNLPVQNPEELVWFGVDVDSGEWQENQSYRLYELLRDTDGPFVGFAAVGPAFPGMKRGEETDLVKADLVTHEYFSLLGARPAVGRLLNDADFAGENGRVAVLGHGIWVEQFGSDPSIVGESIFLNRESFLIVGVAARGFLGTDAARPTGVWLTVDQSDLINYSADWDSADWSWLRIFGRLAPGATQDEAQSAATVVYQQFAEDRVQSSEAKNRERMEQRYASERVHLKPVKSVDPKAYDSMWKRFTPLAAAVGLLLLICCANVANLLLGKGMQRRQEFGVRTAMGASRWQLVRQLLAEGMLTASLGTAAGLAIAAASWRYLQQQVGITGEASVNAAPDLTVVAFTAGLSGLCVLLFALFPALSASRASVYTAMKGGTKAVNEDKGSLLSRGWLVAAQFALCLPLLVGAGLLMQTVDQLFQQDVGFQRQQRVHATVETGASGYEGDRAMVVLDDLLARLREQPSLERVGYSMFGTLGHSYAVRSMPVQRADGDSIDVVVSWSYISEGYFDAMGIPLLAGRDFRQTDDAKAPKVAIVNQAFARQVLDVENPVGHRFEDEIEVVGMIGDAKYGDLRESAPPQIHYPYRQSTLGLPMMQVYAQTPLDLAAFTTLIREQVGQIDPFLRVDGITTMDGMVEERMREEQMASQLLTAFALMALIISAIGLYGVISFDVAGRTREVGLRKALGAQARDIFAMVFRRAAPWVIGGCLAGVAGAAAMTRLLEAKLYGVAALDPLTFASAAAFLLLCAAAANYLPARRAASVEPMTALRHD